MDDPALSWPSWKFGLKRSDLTTSLHDKYNTFTFSLQDPEAFHADVHEISLEANTTDEFHRLMADRRQQRLHELHESLESLAVEIIANPKLMDSEHWTYAVQLFRTRSFDSLVRYFASYLPQGYHDRSEYRSGSVSSSYSDTHSVYTASTKASSVDDAQDHFREHYSNTTTTFTDGPVMTEEPTKMDDRIDHQVDAPLSPPASEVMESTPSPAPTSTYDDAQSVDSSHPPSRSMSFSGSESGHFVSGFCGSLLYNHHHGDDEEITSQSTDDCETTASSTSDFAGSPSSIESIDSCVNDKEELTHSYMEDEVDYDDDDELLTAQFPEDSFDAVGFADETPVESDETPTPRQEAIVTSYLEHKSVSSRRLASPYRRSPSPSPRSFRASASPQRDIRRSPEEAYSKIQKHTLDSSRRRPKGRA